MYIPTTDGVGNLEQYFAVDKSLDPYLTFPFTRRHFQIEPIPVLKTANKCRSRRFLPAKSKVVFNYLPVFALFIQCSRYHSHLRNTCNGTEFRNFSNFLAQHLTAARSPLRQDLQSHFHLKRTSKNHVQSVLISKHHRSSQQTDRTEGGVPK